MLLLIGAAEDWTPAQPCSDLARAAVAAREPVTAIAYHDFDPPNLAVHMNDGLAYPAEGEGSAYSGTDPAARADAMVRVPAFLAR